jgi:hypothetical protein
MTSEKPRIPAFMTTRHIRKQRSTESVTCYDDSFPDYIFYIPKFWGHYWFYDNSSPPIHPDTKDIIQLEDIHLYCYVGKGLESTEVLSLDVGDVLTLRPKSTIKFNSSDTKQTNFHDPNSKTNKELLVQIEDINFSPSGRQAEFSVRHI